MYICAGLLDVPVKSNVFKRQDETTTRNECNRVTLVKSASITSFSAPHQAWIGLANSNISRMQWSLRNVWYVRKDLCWMGKLLDVAKFLFFEVLGLFWSLLLSFRVFSKLFQEVHTSKFVLCFRKVFLG